jgi:hypothetical protein
MRIGLLLIVLPDELVTALHDVAHAVVFAYEQEPAAIQAGCLLADRHKITATEVASGKTVDHHAPLPGILIHLWNISSLSAMAFQPTALDTFSSMLSASSRGPRRHLRSA